MKRIPTAVFSTRDLAEAAALLTLGIPLVGLKPNDKHYLFCFESADAAGKLAQEFWAGRLRVDPRTYALNLRALKDRLFAGR